MIRGMKFSEARWGRVLVVRLEHGDIVHEELEKLAVEQSIRAAALLVLGGADRGSRLIVGPEQGDASPVVPRELQLEDVHEVVGTGTLFPDEEGRPELHMHLACGRGESTSTGCIRRGVRVWTVLEVIVFELADSSAVRRFDPTSGFKLLQP